MNTKAQGIIIIIKRPLHGTSMVFKVNKGTIKLNSEKYCFGFCVIVITLWLNLIFRMLFSCPQKPEATGFIFKPNWIKEHRVTHSTVTQSTHSALSASVLNEFYHSVASFDAIISENCCSGNRKTTKNSF